MLAAPFLLYTVSDGYQVQNCYTVFSRREHMLLWMYIYKKIRPNINYVSLVINMRLCHVNVLNLLQMYSIKYENDQEKQIKIMQSWTIFLCSWTTESVTVTQLVKKFTTFYGTWMFITFFTAHCIVGLSTKENHLDSCEIWGLYGNANSSYLMGCDTMYRHSRLWTFKDGAAWTSEMVLYHSTPWHQPRRPWLEFCLDGCYLYKFKRGTKGTMKSEIWSKYRH
jgi:hypothetical protein